MTRNFTRLGFTAAVLVAGSGIVALAQSTTTGTMTGTVHDKAGTPIAGATVVATSAQMSRTIVTGADGSFRLSLLNPGVWTMKITKAGMQTITGQTVNINTNSVVPVAFKMVPEAGGTVEVVSSEVGKIDTQSTTTGSNLSMETLTGIPKGRDFNTLITLSPGVTSTGIGLSMSGASGLENNFVLDGLDTTDYRKGSQAAALPTDFIDQVDVQTGGFRPEFNALGGVVTAVTKSGSNTFAGSAWITNDMQQLQGVVKTDGFYTGAFPRQRYDLGFTASGAIIQNKLFYFVGVQNIKSQSSTNSITANAIGLSSDIDKADTLNIYGKFNYYITPDQQLSLALTSVGFEDKAPHLVPSVGNAEFGNTAKTTQFNFTLNYDWTIKSDLLLNVKIGRTDQKDTINPVNSEAEVTDRLWFRWGPGTSMTPSVVNTTGFTHGGYGSYQSLGKNETNQFKADISYFLGNHSLKAGVSLVKTKMVVKDVVTGDDGVTTTIYNGTSFGGNSYGTDGSFAVDQVEYKNDATVNATYTSFYAQDQWEFFPGARLAFGFRYDAQKLDGAHVNFVKFTKFEDNWQPRIGLTWDVNNDGKTKFTANYAKYQERMPLQPAMRTSGNEKYNEWTYVSGPSFGTTNATYDPTTGGFTVLHNGTANNGSDLFTSYSAYFNNYEKPIDGIKIPTRTEYMLGIDHTYANGWTAGLHGKYRELKHPIEDSVPTDSTGRAIDANDGYSILWNPHPGIVQFYGNVGSANHGTLFTWNNTVFPMPINIYQSVDFTLDKKTSNYVMSFSYTWSRAYGNYEGVGATSNGQADANITALWDYAAYVGYGNLPLDRTHSAKLYGSYTWPIGQHSFTAGMKGTALSGTPISKFTGANDWGAYGDATPDQGMYGQYGRTPTLLQLDLHFEYVHRIGKTITITPSIDIFNATNNRTVTGVDQNYSVRGSAGSNNATLNTAYGYANGWMDARNYRWGVKVAF